MGRAPLQLVASLTSVGSELRVHHVVLLRRRLASGSCRGLLRARRRRLASRGAVHLLGSLVARLLEAFDAGPDRCLVLALADAVEVLDRLLERLHRVGRDLVLVLP